jgi:AraC-like DNA-binding protein
MASIAPVLAPYVASLREYDVDLGAPGLHRGLPSTSLTFVLPLGEPLDVSWAGSPSGRRPVWSSVSGLHARPAEIHHDGRQRGVQLALTPAGASALLGIPAAALSGELLDLDDLTPLAPGLRQLPERLAGESDAARRTSLVQRTLIDALARNGEPAPRAAVGRARERLTRGVRVSDVAAEVGYSRRHLTALVRRECGLTASDLRRIGRFQASRALLGRRRLAEVAHVCGYADQAHLTREWVALAGCPPTTWLREEFPFLQDVGDDDE